MSDIDKQYDEMLNNATLSEEDMKKAEEIANSLDEVVEENDSLKMIRDLPSNNGVSESESTEVGESKKVMVQVNPNTGEHVIATNAEVDNEDHRSFEEAVDDLDIDDLDIDLDDSPVTEEEFNKIKDDSSKEGLIGEMKEDDFNLSPEGVQGLIRVLNMKMKKEKFNAYKEFPKEIQNMIDNYMKKGGIHTLSKDGKTFRNMISESLLDEFVSNIQADRMSRDFNKEIESIFEEGAKEIADTVIGFTRERNEAYRKYAEGLEDKEKKEKILEILDQIEEAYKLDNLKEFAKKCKIKKIELDKPERVYRGMMDKYDASVYNIYDIGLAVPILFRNLNKDEDGVAYTDKDIKAFFICFCKQCLNMKPSNVIEHAYMYYVMYNCVIMDINKGENSQVSEEFIKNIKEVINNIRVRNNF
jgi:hypothetical protein